VAVLEGKLSGAEGISFYAVLAVMSLILFFTLSLTVVASIWAIKKLLAYFARKKIERLADQTRQMEHVVNTPRPSDLLLPALLAAVPVEPVIGSKLAIDTRHFGAVPHIDVLRRAPPRRAKLFSLAVLAMYLNAAVLAAGKLPQQPKDITSILKRGAVNTTVYSVGELSDPAKINEDLVGLRQVLAQAAQDRNEGYAHDVVIATHGELPADVLQDIGLLQSANKANAMVVPVSDELKQVGEHGTLEGAYSYDKVLNLALILSNGHLEAVLALLNRKYDTASFRTYSRIPAQFTASAALMKVWKIITNLGSGLVVVPAETAAEAARLAEQGA
jgi:hypothetical protein